MLAQGRSDHRGVTWSPSALQTAGTLSLPVLRAGWQILSTTPLSCTVTTTREAPARAAPSLWLIVLLPERGQRLPHTKGSQPSSPQYGAVPGGTKGSLLLCPGHPERQHPLPAFPDPLPLSGL